MTVPLRQIALNRAVDDPQEVELLVPAYFRHHVKSDIGVKALVVLTLARHQQVFDRTLIGALDQVGAIVEKIVFNLRCDAASIFTRHLITQEI